MDYVSNDLYSCGDDLVIRHFDVAAGSIVHSYEDAHEDYIRCVKVLQDNHVLSGGYDNVMRLFDFRVHEKAQLVFNHGEQVEWMDTFPSGMMFVGCGGNKVTLWDIRSEKCLMTASNHKKIVSCVRVVSEGSRFMTASYDTYFKIYKSDTFELTYQ